MRACAAEVKSFEWCAILRPADQRSKREKLIERLFTVVNVSAAESVGLFEIEWCDHLAGDDQVAHARSVRFQMVDHTPRKLFTPRIPIAMLEFLRSKLHVNRHHVFALRRQ